MTEWVWRYTWRWWWQELGGWDWPRLGRNMGSHDHANVKAVTTCVSKLWTSEHFNRLPDSDIVAFNCHLAGVIMQRLMSTRRWSIDCVPGAVTQYISWVTGNSVYLTRGLYIWALMVSWQIEVHFEWIVLVTGLGNWPVVKASSTKIAMFGSWHACVLTLLPVGVITPDMYLSTCSCWCVWLDPSVPISGSALQVLQFIVACRYATAKHKILTLVGHCLVWMYRLL